MTFDDEFSAASLDANKWRTSDAWGTSGYAGNGEVQCYTPNSFWAGGGIMSIVGQRQFKASCPPSYSGSTNYTSGMMTTYGKFAQQYGYFEMRAKLPRGQGLWPAFWLLAADKSIPPEIDILEAVGSRPTQVFQAIHYNEGGAYKTHSDWILNIDATAGFHTYGVDWKPGYLAFYSDGIKRSEFFSGVVPNKPFYIILNLAMGGGWAGLPDGTTPFPAAFQIDYVRVYQRVNNGQPDATPPFGQVGGGGGGGGGGTTPGTVGLVRSSSPDRSGASALQGATVAGNVYVFTTPDTGVAAVDFSLDGRSIRRESLAPFDFAGSNGSSANAFNASSLSAGSHTITAKVTASNGTVQTANATFTVGSTGGGSSTGIFLSYSPTRSGAVPLNGQWVNGNIYVYTNPDAGVASVKYYLDGSLVKTEVLGPFDLGGTGTGGALPFNASGLATGNHTLIAQVTMTDGSTRTVTAAFHR